MHQRNTEYFSNLFEICKEIAFHQIYIQSCRKDLASDQNYDPKTAFKSMDHFKHNRVVPYELWSFFQRNHIQSTIEQCESVIQSLDKSLGEMDYESFQELTATLNITLKNLSKTRYDHVSIGVGSFAKLTYVKEHSQHCIALFLQKQLNFYRHFLFIRQEFCRKWGGDIYTLLQRMFKKGEKTLDRGISFQQFFQLGRLYGHIFNKVQFMGIWRRSKDKRATIDQISGNVQLTYDQLQKLVLVKNLDTKLKYALQRNIPIYKALQKPTPSYKVNHMSQHLKWQRDEKMKQIEQMERKASQRMPVMKYNFTSWQSLQDPLYLRGYLRQKSHDWCSNVEKMSAEGLAQTYRNLTSGSCLIRR